MNTKKFPFVICLFFLFIQIGFLQADTFLLRENLKKAKTGDYLVSMQNKTLTLFRIDKTDANSLFIEEISIPAAKFQSERCSFRAWYEQGSPRSSSKHLYEIDLTTGAILNSFIFSNHEWYKKPLSNVFLSTLLSLRLYPVPFNERKKTGRVSSAIWHPRLKFEGQIIENVPFTAWRTKWPDDKSELSGKTIEIYTPDDSELYPSYLPYWLEISGMMGNAKIRIIDSGRNLNSTGI